MGRCPAVDVEDPSSWFAVQLFLELLVIMLSLWRLPSNMPSSFEFIINPLTLTFTDSSSLSLSLSLSSSYFQLILRWLLVAFLAVSFFFEPQWSRSHRSRIPIAAACDWVGRMFCCLVRTSLWRETLQRHRLWTRSPYEFYDYYLPATFFVFFLLLFL